MENDAKDRLDDDLEAIRSETLYAFLDRYADTLFVVTHALDIVKDLWKGETPSFVNVEWMHRHLSEVVRYDGMEELELSEAAHTVASAIWSLRDSVGPDQTVGEVFDTVGKPRPQRQK